MAADQFGDGRVKQPVDAGGRVTGAQLYQDRDRVNDIADGGRLYQQNPLERLFLKRLIQGPSPRRRIRSGRATEGAGYPFHP